MSLLRDIIIIVALLATLLGCEHENKVDDNRRAAIDSVAASLDTTALVGMADSLASVGDRMAELWVRQRLGKQYRDMSRFDDAIVQHNRALELASKLQDTIEIVRALNNLGTNFRRLGIMEEATVYHYQALSFCDRYSDKMTTAARKNRVVSLNGIGNIYMTIGNLEMADSVLRAALEGEKELESDLGQAINWANLGAIMRERGMNDSAWYYYKRSMELNRLAGSELGQSLCHTHMGEMLEDEGLLDSAITEYSKAYAILDTCNDVWHWLEACQALARVNIERGNWAQADHYIALSDSAATRINSLEHKAETYNLKYLEARRQNRISDALEYYLHAEALKDSVVSNNNMGHILNTRIGFERERRQAELDKVMESYRTERWLKNLFIMLVVLVVILAAVIINLLRVRNHNQLLANQLLAEQLLAHSGTTAQARAEGDRAFLEKFTQAIKAGIDEHHLDMESVASQLCITGGQLRRRIVAITGTTPMAYANSVRMAQASRLLTDYPEMSVSDVAEQCGFDDMAYFSRLFKKTYKLTPTQFRRS